MKKRAEQRIYEKYDGRIHEAVQAGTFLLEKYLVMMQRFAKWAGPVVGSLVVALCESIQGVPESCFGHSRLDRSRT